MRLRTGRKVTRTLYLQIGPEPRDTDPIIGLLDEPWASLVAHAYNAWLKSAEYGGHQHHWSYESHFGEDFRECPCGVKQTSYGEDDWR